MRTAGILAIDAALDDATTSIEQPSVVAPGYTSIQTVETISSPTKIPSYEDAVVAPAASAEPAAAGASLSSETAAATNVSPSPFLSP